MIILHFLNVNHLLHHIFVRHFVREGRRALRVGPLAEAVVVERSNGEWGMGPKNASFSENGGFCEKGGGYPVLAKFGATISFFKNNL